VTGRAGLAFDRVLLYAKGGAAWAADRFSFLAPSGRNGTTDQTRTGWIGGVGVEYAFAGSWSAKVEYNYMDFGTKHVTFTTDFADIQQRVQTIKAGVNYRFGGPIIAQY
jgi:outer membrane immunogenic protein